MKTEILQIADKLREGIIDYKEAKVDLLVLFDINLSNCLETDNFRVYLPKDDESVLIIEDYFQKRKTIDIVDFNNLMNILCSVKDY